MKTKGVGQVSKKPKFLEKLFNFLTKVLGFGQSTVLGKMHYFSNSIGDRKKFCEIIPTSPPY